MKTLLLAALLPLVSLAYEVSSLSSESSPTFIYTEDGESGLTYPVASENTFGSPDWYEHAEYIGTPVAWKMVVDGNVISNKSGQGQGPDPWHSFDFHCEPPYYPSTIPSSTGETSEWFVTYDFMKFNYAGMFGYFGLDQAVIPGMSTNEGSRAWFVDAPYDDFGFVQSHDITGPGTIEFRFWYPTDSTNDVNKTNCATLFPVLCPANITSTYVLYPDAYDPPEIWLPKFQRLTPASRSALMAAYEAYFERMYYGSRGDSGRPESETEWGSLGFTHPGSQYRFADPSPDFVFDQYYRSADRGLLDVFDYPASARGGETPAGLRRWAPASFRLMPTDSDLVSRLCKSVRKMWPPVFHYVPLNPGSGFPPYDLSAASFLLRPQWTADGHENPFTGRRESYFRSWDFPRSPNVAAAYGEFLPEVDGTARLWWSSRVPPPPVPQSYVRDSSPYYVPTAAELARAFPALAENYYYVSRPGEGPYYHPPIEKDWEDFPVDYRSASGGFVFDPGLTGDAEGLFPSSYYPEHPLEMLWGSLQDDVLADGDDFHPGDMYYMVPTYSTVAADGSSAGWTYEDFITNSFRTAARSLPLAEDAYRAWISGFADASDGSMLRVDSSPLAVASQALSLMDRVVSYPLQAFACTNAQLEAVHFKQFYGPGVDRLYSVQWTYEPVIVPGQEGSEPAEVWASPSVNGTGARTFELASTNDQFTVTEVARVEERVVSVYANPPSAFNVPESCVGDMDVKTLNEPVKSLRVGDRFIFAPGTGPVGDWSWYGAYVFSGIPYPQHAQIGEGPYVNISSLVGGPVRGDIFVLTHFSGGPPTVNVSLTETWAESARSWTFADGEGTGDGQCGVYFGSVPKVDGLGPGPYPSAEAHVGWVFAAKFQSRSDDWYDEYSCVKLRTGEGTWDSRDGLREALGVVTRGMVDEVSRDMGAWFSDPRNPDVYGPVPGKFTQKAYVGTDVPPEGYQMYWLYGDCQTHVDIPVEEDAYAVEASYYLETSRSIRGESFGHQATNIVRTQVVDITEWYTEIEGHPETRTLTVVETNGVMLTYSGSLGPYVEDESSVEVESETGSVTVVVWEYKTPVHNVIVTDSSVRHVEYVVNTEAIRVTKGGRVIQYRDPGGGGVIGDGYEEPLPGTRVSLGPFPYPGPVPPPAVIRETRTYQVSEGVGDAIPYRSNRFLVTARTVFRYAPLFHVYNDNGIIDRISLEPVGSAPQVEDVDEFVVAVTSFDRIGFSEHLLRTDPVTYPGSGTGAYDGEKRRFGALASLRALLWVDWTWNALKRD